LLKTKKKRHLTLPHNLVLDRQTKIAISTAGDAASQVSEKLRKLADEHYDNSNLNTALLLGADFIDFQGEKIDLQSKELELLGFKNDELCAQIARVKDLLSGQRKILDAMPERDRALFKAFQVSRWYGLGWPGVDLTGCRDRGIPAFFPRACRPLSDH